MDNLSEIFNLVASNILINLYFYNIKLLLNNPFLKNTYSVYT